jgi:xanthine/uracil permease
LNLHHNLRRLIVYTLLACGVACSTFRLHIGNCAYILGSSSG